MNYEQLATDFITKNNIEFKAQFIKNDFYFSDDKDKRDIYEITFKRGKKQINFKFGNSLNNSGLKRIKPTAYDVLACLTYQDPENFEFFCKIYGYDQDSIKAYKIFENVQEEYKKVTYFFSNQEIEELQKII